MPLTKPGLALGGHLPLISTPPPPAGKRGANMSDLYLQHLLQAVSREHECEAEHLETVPVIKRRKGKTVWKGNVEVFRLKGHPKAKRAYAWAPDQKTDKAITVLEDGTVTSPHTAVEAVIAGGGQ